MKRTALITGASAGIGEAFAVYYANRGDDVVLVARRADRLAALAERLQIQHGVTATVIQADLADPNAPLEIKAAVDAQGINIDILVNNAGYGVPLTYLDNTWETHRATLQVMITAVAELTYLFLPAMRERGSGVLINVSSVAGHVPGTAGHTLYGAVKAWMIRFSESLGFELRAEGINVCAVCPGFTYSEFHDVTGTREQVSGMPAYMWMSAEEVVAQSVQAAERGELVYINGGVNRFIVRAMRYLPRKLGYWLMNKRASDFRRVN